LSSLRRMFLFKLVYCGSFLRRLLQHPAENLVELSLVGLHSLISLTNSRGNPMFFGSLCSRVACLYSSLRQTNTYFSSYATTVLTCLPAKASVTSTRCPRCILPSVLGRLGKLKSIVKFHT